MKGVFINLVVLAMLFGVALCGNLQVASSGAGREESASFNEQLLKALMNSDVDSPKIDMLIDVKSDILN